MVEVIHPPLDLNSSSHTSKLMYIFHGVPRPFLTSSQRLPIEIEGNVRGSDKDFARKMCNNDVHSVKENKTSCVQKDIL